MVKKNSTRRLFCAFVICSYLRFCHLLLIVFALLIGRFAIFNKDFIHAAFNHSSVAKRYDCS